MSGGFNTNVERGGRVLHLQTQQCWGRPAVVESLVYDGGRIVASLINSFAEANDGTEAGSARVRRMMRLQHHRLLLEIREGLHDGSLDVQRLPGPAGEPAPRSTGPGDRRLALERVLSRLERNVAAEQERHRELPPSAEHEPTPEPAAAPGPAAPVGTPLDGSRLVVRMPARRVLWAAAALVLLLGAVALVLPHLQRPVVAPAPMNDRPASLLALPQTPAPSPTAPPRFDSTATFSAAPATTPDPQGETEVATSQPAPTEPAPTASADPPHPRSVETPAELEPLPQTDPARQPVVSRAVEPVPTAPVAVEPVPAVDPPATPAPARLVPARPIRRELPAYPKKDRRRGVEGVVRLRLSIDARGNVGGVEILESVPGAQLHEVVEVAAAGWRFAPATRDGRPVAEERAVTVQFELGPGRGEIVRVVEDRPL